MALFLLSVINDDYCNSTLSEQKIWVKSEQKIWLKSGRYGIFRCINEFNITNIIIGIIILEIKL